MENMRIRCTSTWRKGDKVCRVHGTKEMGSDYTFRITGWNPLPCKSFKGTYKILADWLIANGWEREVGDMTYMPDIIRYIY